VRHRVSTIIASHRIIQTLAGGGKTHSLIDIAEKASSMGLKVLYLTFNRKIRREVIRKSKLNKHQVHTFHSFAFHELIKNGLMKEVLKGYTDEELQQYFDIDLRSFPEISKKALNSLISLWCECFEMSTKTSYDIIIVDEFQDLNSQMFRMLKLLYQINIKNDVKIIVAGDPYQNIYHHLNESKAENYFNSFGKHFGEYEVTNLNICYRCSPSIQKFVNGFYKKQYKNYRQFDLSRYKSTDFTEDVFIHAIQHKKQVREKVRDIINLNQGKDITIMGRVYMELEPLSDLVSENELVSISSIHSEKGKECDVAIIINTKFNDKILTEADKNLWNVAITRAKEKVHIVTSFPQATIAQLFEDGTYTLISEQKNLSTSTMPTISDESIDLTLEKVQKSLIDSIEIQLPEDEAPFIPYERQNLEKRSPYKTDTMMTRKSFKFALHRHNERLTFNCSNLSQLKNKGFNDQEILNYILDAEKEYFDYIISDEEILQQKVRKLDLAKYIEVSSQKIQDILLYILRLSKNSNSPSDEVKAINGFEDILKLHQKSDSTSNEFKKINSCGDEEGHRTIYLNSLKSMNRVLRIYFPQFKKINPLNAEKLILKVELFRIRESKKANDVSINYTVKELLELIENDQLEKLYYQWLEYEFPFLKEKAVKNVEMIKEKRNIKSFNELKVLIEKGNIHSREKRHYFYILLSFLSKQERDEIMKVFPMIKKM